MGRAAEKGRVWGKVVTENDRPVEAAVVLLPVGGQWTVTDKNGSFTLLNAPAGDVEIRVSCLGYADGVFRSGKKRGELTLVLKEDNLALESAVVTAEESSSSAATTRKIDRKALDHLQLLDVGDISSLLPGGKTLSPDLSSSGENKFAVRGTSFGTALEVDGVRLSNNASPDETTGSGTRNIASSDVASVEVISGIPSVEYGDLTGGVVRIRTQNGKTPWKVSVTANPRTKQISLSKGFSAGKAGVFNVSAERTRSVRNLASPYTAYTRNGASLKWSQTFNKDSRPLRLGAVLTGNIGGMDSHSDPDANIGNYSKARDNLVRGQLTLDWMANLSWLTNLEVTASVSYADKLQETCTRKSYASAPVAIHGVQEGYFVARPYTEYPDAPVVLLKSGTWYETAFTDSRPLDYSLKAKASWNKSWGGISNHLKLGFHFDGTRNFGRGQYYETLAQAPDWRPWPYYDLPAMHNLALFAEDNLTLPIGSTRLQLTAGLRWDNTLVGGTQYGPVSSLSPRGNLKYTLIEGKGFVRHLSLRGGYGIACKLPSFQILYPSPSYTDVLSFTPGTLPDGSTWYAWYILPHQLEYNPSLRWQKARQSELGLELELPFVKLSLSAWYNRQEDSYVIRKRYEPYHFKFTDRAALDVLAIPAENRIYSIDRESGVVTVSDRSGALPAQQLVAKDRDSFIAKTYPDNGSPTHRAGVEWVLEFQQIKAIRTSFRIDGNYSYYKNLDVQVQPYYPGTLQADGNYYPYVGYYTGGASASNGTLSESVDLNLTAITHIPKVRLIFTLKLEAGLMRYRQALSESPDGARSYAVNDKGSFEPSDGNIYDSNRYTITYPSYYVSVADPETRIPFRERFAWAKDNDPALYQTLQWLVVRSNYGYTMNASRISPFFSANFSVTKEIGKIASLSFYANNFVHNMATVTSSQNGNELPLFGSTYIPEFYYGITLRLKF